MPELINWGLLKHPLNWFVIFSMLLVTAYTAHLVLTHLDSGQIPDKGNQ